MKKRYSPVLTAREIRKSFIDFFLSKKHTFVPSSPIVPHGDETLLFANAGMNQFKDIFLGLRTPDCPSAVNSQKCLRVSGKHNDLEEVGMDTYHHTFFEMLGNWSFNDYFKAEAIAWAWELMTKVWGVNPDQLYASVFAGDEKDGIPRDDEAAQLWTRLTPIPPERVMAFGKKENFWEMGETGPCGPCSEIHIDLGPDRCDKKGVPGHKCRVNGDCARFIELWNLVFIQYNRQTSGNLVPLSAKYIDTGAGLERVVRVLQDKGSNYDTDLFMPIIEATAKMSGHKYTSVLGNKTDNAFRVIADHSRTLVFAITDGATPSNEGRGYVIRRILRRAARYGRELDLREPFLYKLVPVVVECLGEAFPEIRARAEYVTTVIQAEETGFGRTLDRGLEIFNAAAARAAGTKDKTLTGDDAFQLYDTFGFPPDLTGLLAREKGLSVDIDRFNELMKEQKERARAAQKTDSLLAGLADSDLPTTEDLNKYRTDRCDASILGWIDSSGFKKEGILPTNAEIGLVLDRTCFYAEAGGQVGDTGVVSADGGRFVVESTMKLGNAVIHRGQVAEGSLRVGQSVTAAVSPDRNATKKNHTATHLLQWALQHVLGKSVAQQGSYVGPDYLRFDFTYPKAPTTEELARIQQLVRDKIAEDLPVAWTVLPREQAEKLGAMALFGEKYGSEVRVVCVGAADEDHIGEAFSREFCGGTHVDRLGVIGGIKILKEESVSAGVRRITALTGQALTAHLEKAGDIVEQLTSLLQIPADKLTERIGQIVEDNKKLVKQLKTASKAGGPDTMAEAKALLEAGRKIGETAVVVGRLATTSVDRAREAIDMLKKKAKSAVVVLAYEEEGKVMLLAGVTDDLIKKIKAGDIVKQIAPIVDGGGGGKPQLAQAGGKNPARIDEALSKAGEMIAAALA
ncbi:MAG TPA: alanine--tRNA ligase [Sedimentisphaerales bacterium]|nr:alanine--tRNA ligase [Sedimentisphaerales bacterium]